MMESFNRIELGYRPEGLGEGGGKCFLLLEMKRNEMGNDD